MDDRIYIYDNWWDWYFQEIKERWNDYGKIIKAVNLLMKYRMMLYAYMYMLTKQLLMVKEKNMMQISI